MMWLQRKIVPLVAMDVWWQSPFARKEPVSPQQSNTRGKGQRAKQGVVTGRLTGSLINQSIINQSIKHDTRPQEPKQ
jgi:hypothetical protein